jgi:pyridoxamine 5'-phosphate oxidase
MQYKTSAIVKPRVNSLGLPNNKCRYTLGMNDPEHILSNIWQTLARGVHDAKHEWHWPVLGTVDASNHQAVPQLRTVVLRQLNKDAHWLEVHSDSRAAKINQLKANPQAQLLFYDSRHRVQLRATAHVTIHHQDEDANQAWEKLGNLGQAQYQMTAVPGTPLTQAQPEDLIAQPDQSFFAVLRLQLLQMDWLHLKRGGHERAQFTLVNDQWTETILVP